MTLGDEVTEPARLSTTEAAARLGIPERTLRAWLERYRDRLFPRAFRTPGGWWRIDVRDVDALANRRAEQCSDSE